MKKITLICTKENVDQLIEFAWTLKSIHLIENTNINLKNLEMSDIELKETKYKLDNINEIENIFKSYHSFLYDDSVSKNPITLFDYTNNEKLTYLYDELNNWKKGYVENESKKSIYFQYQNILDNLIDIIPNLPLDSLLGTRGLIIREYNPKIISLFRKRLEIITGNNYDLTLHIVSKNFTIGSLVYSKEFEDDIKELLDEINISEISLPSFIKGNSFHDRLEAFEEEIKKIETNEILLIAKLNGLFSIYSELKEFKKILFEKINKFYGIKYLKISENFVILQGYVPKRDINRIKIELEKMNNLFDLYYDITEAKGEIPTKISNKKGIKEFQLFTGMLPPLAYNTVDPTFWIAIFFPFFFGFIVGDIAYGLIIMGFGYLLSRNKNQTYKNIGWILVIAGFSAVIFGILYGEFFGNFAEVIGIHPLWMQRSKDLINLLMYSIIIGFCHIILGIIIGIINSQRVGNIKLLIYNFGQLFLLVGVAVIAVSSVMKININTTLSFLIILISIILIFYGEGFIGIIEILGLVGNILSYARLMALGIASVILADLANNLYFVAGGGIIGIILAILLHVLNIIIAMFSPSIHSMRLHLVEFFNKFVEYGNVPYSPFGIYNSSIN